MAFQRKELQHPLSMAHGYHHVFFLHHHNRGLPFVQLLNYKYFFKNFNDLVQNDQMVIHFVKYEYGAFPVARATQNRFQKTQTCLSFNVFHKCNL